MAMIVCIGAKPDKSLPALAGVDNDGCTSVLLLTCCQPDRTIWLKGPQHRLQAK